MPIVVREYLTEERTLLAYLVAILENNGLIPTMPNCVRLVEQYNNLMAFEWNNCPVSLNYGGRGEITQE